MVTFLNLSINGLTSEEAVKVTRLLNDEKQAQTNLSQVNADPRQTLHGQLGIWHHAFDDFIVKRFDKDYIMNKIAIYKAQNPSINIYFMTDIDELSDNDAYLDINNIKTISKDSIVILAYEQDYKAWDAINELMINKIKYLGLDQPWPPARYYHINKYAYEALLDEWKKPDRVPFYYNAGDFEVIFQAIEQTKDLPGCYVEIGTYKGASARAALNFLKRIYSDKMAYFCDTYEGFNYEEAKNSEDKLWYNTHGDTSISAVGNFLKGFKNFELVKMNIISDDFPPDIKQISCANVDVDIYEAVKAALIKVDKKLVRYGIMICEDYGHTPTLIGSEKALEEFLQEKRDNYINIYMHSGQMMLIKIK